MQEILKFLDLSTLDATMILVAIPLFLLFQKGIEKTLIRPFLDRLNDRDALTVGAGASSQEIIEEAVAIEQQYSKKIAETRSAAMHTRNSKVGAAKDQAAALVHDAENKAAALVAAERQKVRQEVETQRQTLLKDVDALAKGVVEKLMQPRALKIIFLLVSFSFLTGIEAAFAEEAAHGDHGASHGYGYLFWYWVNFLVYIGAMYFILHKKVLSGWEGRREKIRFALEAGKRSMQEAVDRLDAAKDQLLKLDSEIKEITSSIEREAELQSKKLLEEAAQKVEEISKNASESAGQEAKAQKAQMQREIAEIVLARATEMLKGSVTKESDKVLRESTLAGVKSLMQ